MNKKCLIILKGYELMQEIANGKIKEGTKFRDLTDSNYADNSNIYRYENKNFIGRYGGTNILKLLNHDFEILEDEEETGISKLKKEKVLEENPAEFRYDLRYYYDKEKMGDKINEIIKKVNELDKKLNKED